MAYQTSCDLHRSSQLDAELDESQERLALAAEAANLDFWEYDPERDRFWISEPLVELFGFTPGEPITLATWLEKVHPDDRPGVADKAARLLATGGRMEFEYRIIAPSGEIRWLSARGRYLAERGSFAYGINLDVTQQREQLYERDQLQQQLAHASRVTMLGQFASALAHELNQPLGAILRNTEAAELLLAAPAPDLEQLRAITQDILRDDRRASEVIARLRKMLKQQAREHRAVDVAILFSDVLALVQPEAAARGISLQSTLEAGAMVVRGDPVHLQQVLLNLVINGMQAVDSGSASERSVRISALPRDDGMLEFSVSDSGPGLPAGLEKRVFEPFFTTRTTGMGLGLSICRTIIEAHGGRIWVDAQAGGGTAFRFTLPIEPESVAS
jgi:signal transduction histidine kinase